MIQVQQNIGSFISVMPGARMLSMVTRMLMAPMMDDAPMMCTAKIAMSMPTPICSDSGGYMVQPEPVAPPPAKNDPLSSKPPGGNSQNEKLFIRANAMPEAPI